MPTKIDSTYAWNPTSGTVENLVCLVRWSDHKSRPLPTREKINAILNRPADAGYVPPNTVHHYFFEQSQGRLDLRFTVTDWIDLPWAEADAKNKLDLVCQHLLATVKRDWKAGEPIILLHSGFDKLFNYSPGVFWSSLGFQPVYPGRNEPLQRYIISSALHGISGSVPLRPALIAHEISHSFGLIHHLLAEGEPWCLQTNMWQFDRSLYRVAPLCWECREALGWLEPPVVEPPAPPPFKHEDVLRLVLAARYGARPAIDKALEPFAWM